VKSCGFEDAPSAASTETPGLHEAEQALVERAHPVVPAVRDHVMDLRRLVGIGDPLRDPSRVHEDLVARHQPALLRRHQALAHDAAQRAGVSDDPAQP
jgi:hypothetical protein